ncbi:alpha/beta hydrolase [Acidisoma sp. L85]|uniref:alpha/beta hydrolase n=1 Tax=Acidisoma sp. L85 TaxID=1641850 RepID=UPI00131B7C23|nr:alpha/beta hydrolase [Acidisoma sp. L85]
MRRSLAGLAGVAALALTASATLNKASARPLPTIWNIVLVHGAWADGSGWKGVYDILKRDHYHVTVVANPNTGLADDVAATERVLALQDGPTILVGHSYGGAVITEAGNDAKVVGLVYIAAFAPDQGKSCADYLPKGPLPVVIAPGGFAFLTHAAFVGAFAPDVRSDVREFMADAQAPIAGSAIGAPITDPAWRTKPSWYLVSKNDKIIPPDSERKMALQAKAVTEEVSGSHVAFIAHPEVAAHLIERAAETMADRLKK